MGPDLAVAVAARLSETQRRVIVHRFTTLNPRWEGAEAADILDTLWGADSDLDRTEPFFEAHPDLASIPGAGIAARAVIWSGQPLEAGRVRALLGEEGGARD